MSKSAMLVDISRCIGCETCTAACTMNRGLPIEDKRVLWTNIKGFEVGQFPAVSAFFTKRQCMHCESPACVSACPVGALQKTPGGPVVYDASKCIGCRYCMTACPFGVPKLDWDSLLPSIQKCNFCFDRQVAGLEPACVSACLTGALQFGDRDALLREARQRIQTSGGRYVNYIYGEREVGGLSWLYISSVPFERLGFPTLGKEPVTELSEQVMIYGTPTVAVVAALTLGGFYWFTRRKARLQGKGAAVGAETREE